jgi:2-hydroxychromene-2-carboxylate isomerase
MADWYFDFISPFAYLQFVRLGELAGARLRLRPVLFAGLLQHWGQLGPAEIPAKRRFTYRHVLWRARTLGVALRFPPAHPFNPLGVLRLAIACGAQREQVGALFDGIWRDGLDPEADWDALCASVALSGEQGRAMIGSDAVKTALRANTEQAIAAGVFGVPTLVVGGQLFWGVDATEMATAYLGDRALFDDGEMRRVSTLPSGRERPRGGRR